MKSTFSIMPSHLPSFKTFSPTHLMPFAHNHFFASSLLFTFRAHPTSTGFSFFFLFNVIYCFNVHRFCGNLRSVGLLGNSQACLACFFILSLFHSFNQTDPQFPIKVRYNITLYWIAFEGKSFASSIQLLMASNQFLFYFIYEINSTNINLLSPHQKKKKNHFANFDKKVRKYIVNRHDNCHLGRFVPSCIFGCPRLTLLLLSFLCFLTKHDRFFLAFHINKRKK